MSRGAYVGGKAGAQNLVLFRVKLLRPAMGAISCVRRVRLGSFRLQSVPPLCSAMGGCSRVRDSIRLLTLWLQIAWLHQGCLRDMLPDGMYCV